MKRDFENILDSVSSLAIEATKVTKIVKDEAEIIVKSQIEQWINKLDLVSREQFDIAWEMARKAREENVELSKKLNSLEEKIDKLLALQDQYKKDCE